MSYKDGKHITFDISCKEGFKYNWNKYKVEPKEERGKGCNVKLKKYVNTLNWDILYALLVLPVTVPLLWLLQTWDVLPYVSVWLITFALGNNIYSIIIRIQCTHLFCSSINSYNHSYSPVLYSLYFYLYILIYMCIYLRVCMCTMCLPRVYWGQTSWSYW